MYSDYIKKLDERDIIFICEDPKKYTDYTICYNVITKHLSIR